MPNPTLGFTGQELVDRVVQFIGNTSDDFSSYVANTLIFAEMRFIKAHDWSFLRKTGLQLTVSSGTNEYELNVSTIGFRMKASDVHQIVNRSAGIPLEKVTLNQLRRLDPENDDGEATSDLTRWADVGDERIFVYPKTFQTANLHIDGKITPVPLTELSSYPTIPLIYQETFYEYLLWAALDRENDSRAPMKRQEVYDLIQRDIQHDDAGLASVFEPRIRDWREAAGDGAGQSLDFLFYPFN
jgi:hypothetical protein